MCLAWPFDRNCPASNIRRLTLTGNTPHFNYMGVFPSKSDKSPLNLETPHTNKQGYIHLRSKFAINCHSRPKARVQSYSEFLGARLSGSRKTSLTRGRFCAWRLWIFRTGTPVSLDRVTLQHAHLFPHPPENDCDVAMHTFPPHIPTSPHPNTPTSPHAHIPTSPHPNTPTSPHHPPPHHATHPTPPPHL